MTSARRILKLAGRKLPPAHHTRADGITRPLPPPGRGRPNTSTNRTGTRSDWTSRPGVVRDSNSRHQQLLPPANWCPMFGPGPCTARTGSLTCRMGRSRATGVANPPLLVLVVICLVLDLHLCPRLRRLHHPRLCPSFFILVLVDLLGLSPPSSSSSHSPPLTHRVMPPPAGRSRPRLRSGRRCGRLWPTLPRRRRVAGRPGRTW